MRPQLILREFCARATRSHGIDSSCACRADPAPPSASAGRRWRGGALAQGCGRRASGQRQADGTFLHSLERLDLIFHALLHEYHSLRHACTCRRAPARLSDARSLAPLKPAPRTWFVERAERLKGQECARERVSFMVIIASHPPGHHPQHRHRGRVGVGFDCSPGEHPRIIDVERGSVAEAAGLRANDRILQVGEFQTLGANPQRLAQELAAGGPGGQRILRVSRQLGAGMTVFSLALKTEASTLPSSREPGPSEPRWNGQPDSDRIVLADGSKRDRDLFEQGADLVDGLWAPPPKARNPPARPARRLVEPTPKRDSGGTWDPFGNLLPDLTGRTAAEQPRTAAQRQPEHAGSDYCGPAAARGADAEFARRQRLGQMSTTNSGVPPAAMHSQSADALWYLMQQESLSRQIVAGDEQIKATPEGSLDVVVLEAYDLPMATTFGLADAYCTADLGRSRLSTRVINNELNPTFNTILRFRAVRCESITIRIMNKTLLGDSQIGLVSVPWDEAQRGQIKEYPVLSSTGRNVQGVHKTPSRLRLQVRIGPGTVIDLASGGVHNGLNGAAAAAQGPPHLSAAEGVTLTLAEDYLTAKNREGTWRHELARDICAALRCNPSRFQYVGMRSGSILASFNLLPVAPGDADKRTARNLASELALQVYDVYSPLRTSPTTAKAIDVTLHPPPAPRVGDFFGAPGDGAFLHTLDSRGVGQDSVTAPPPAPLSPRGPRPPPHPEVHAPGEDSLLWQQIQYETSVPRGSIARPVFGTDAVVPLLDKMFQPAAGAPAGDATVARPRHPLIHAAPNGSKDTGKADTLPQHSAPGPRDRVVFGTSAYSAILEKSIGAFGLGNGVDSGGVKKDSVTPGAGASAPGVPPAAPAAPQPQQTRSIAAIRMKLSMSFDQCGLDGSVQRHMFKQGVTSDLAMAAKLPALCFNIISLSPGSILVDTEIDADPSVDAASRDPLVTALDLQNQARYFLYGGHQVWHMRCKSWHMSLK